MSAIVKAPPAAIEASPLMFPKIASSKLLNVIDLMAFEAFTSPAYKRSSWAKSANEAEHEPPSILSISIAALDAIESFTTELEAS